MSGYTLGGGGTVHGNIEELRAWTPKLKQLSTTAGVLALESSAVGGGLSVIGVTTPQFPAMVAATGQLSAGLGRLVIETEALHVGLAAAATAYEEVEAQIASTLSDLIGVGVLARVAGDYARDGIIRTEDFTYLVNNGLPFADSIITMGATAIAPVIPAAPLALMAVRATWQLSATGYRLTTGKEANTMNMMWTIGNSLVASSGLLRLGQYQVTETTRDTTSDGWAKSTAQVGSVSQMMDHAEGAFAENAGDSSIMITKYTKDDGSEVVQVTIPGTQFGEVADWQQDLGFETNAWGASGMREAMIMDSQHVIEAVMAALEDAGIEPGAQVLIDGYSQGGTHATNLAVDERFNQRFDVVGLVTYGGVNAHIDTPQDLKVLNIFHEQDRARYLAGNFHNESVNRMSVVLTGEHPEYARDAGPFGGGHSYESLKYQAQQVLDDPQIQEDISHLSEHFADLTTGTVETKTYQMTRQDPGMPQNPLAQAVHSARAAEVVSEVQDFRVPTGEEIQDAATGVLNTAKNNALTTGSEMLEKASDPARTVKGTAQLPG